MQFSRCKKRLAIIWATVFIFAYCNAENSSNKMQAETANFARVLPPAISTKGAWSVYVSHLNFGGH